MAGTNKWNRTGGGVRRSRVHSRISLRWIAIVIVAAAGGISWWALRGDGGEGDEEVAAAHGRGGLIATNAPAKAAAPDKAPAAGASAAKAPVVLQEADTNRFRLVNGFKVPKGARLVRNSLTNKPVRVFERASDALIASYLQPAEGGIVPPPLPMVGNASRKFLESLSTPIEIDDDDSEEVRRLKEAVIVAREQIKQRMDEGESFEAILGDHYRLSVENAKIRRNAQKELDAIYCNGDADGATRYRMVMDVALSQMGIDALDEPMTHAQRKQLNRLRNAEAEASSRQAEGK